MAIGITTWEVRQGGDDTNGGGFVPGAASGTDYTLQDAAEVANTDLACSGIVTLEVTSSGSTFAPDMIGNLIQVASGTNFTPGFYEVKGYEYGWSYDETENTGDKTLIADTGTLSFPNSDWSFGGWFQIVGNNAGTAYKYMWTWPDINTSIYILEASVANANYLKTRFLGASADIVSDAAISPLNDWHHVLAQRDSGVLTIYIDGVAQSTTRTLTVGIDIASDMYFGLRGNDHNVDRYYNGNLRDWAKWDRAISVGADSELSAIVAGGAAADTVDGAPDWNIEMVSDEATTAGSFTPTGLGSLSVTNTNVTAFTPRLILDRNPTDGVGAGSVGDFKLGGALATLGAVGRAWTLTGSNTNIGETPHQIFVKYEGTNLPHNCTNNVNGGGILFTTTTTQSCFILGYDDESDRSYCCNPINRPVIEITSNTNAAGHFLKLYSSTQTFIVLVRNLHIEYNVAVSHTGYFTYCYSLTSSFENVKIAKNDAITSNYVDEAFTGSCNYNCEAYRCYRPFRSGSCYGCFANQCSSYSFYFVSRCVNCIANSGIGFHVYWGPAINCIADGTTYGFMGYSTDRSSHFINCIAVNGTYGFKASGGNQHIYNCATGNNSSGRHYASTGFSADINPIILSDDGDYFVDPDNYDYRPRANADGQLLLNTGVGHGFPINKYNDLSVVAHTKHIPVGMNGGMKG